MTDDLPSAADLRAEIDALPAARLQEAARAGGWPVHPLRARLDTPGRLDAARRTIAELDCDHAAEVWRSFDAQARGDARAVIARRQTDALARAWERLGGGRELLFHARGPSPRGEDRLLEEVRLGAPRIAIDPNPGVRPAPCLAHPLSFADAVQFAVLLPLLRRCAELGEAAARAFDGFGQATHALRRRAEQQREAADRRIVWRRRRPAPGAPLGPRILTMIAAHVLLDVDATAAPGRFDLPALARHRSDWSELEAVTLGALAWRLACERDLRVRRYEQRESWHAVDLRPEVVGRRYRELDDPFAALLALLRLGCRLHACSPEALTFELVAGER